MAALLQSIFIGLLFVGGAPLATAESLKNPLQYSEIELPSHRHLVIERSAETVSKPAGVWVVYLPGSGGSLFSGDQSLWLRTFAEAGYGQILVINKSGLSLQNRVCANEFNIGALRQNRINDIKLILRNLIPKRAKIWLVGESEGAYIAPDVATKDARVKKLFLISAGTRSWIEEEISFVAPDRQAAVRLFLESNVVGHPSFSKTYNGWTYAQLDSYHNDRTLQSLRKLKIPVLMLNGAKDHATWVTATTADALSLINNENKTNLDFHLIPEGNHALGCDAGNQACSPGDISKFEVGLFQNFMSRK